MSIESEALGIAEGNVMDEAAEIAAEVAEPQEISLLSWLAEVFRVETGPGEIKEYQDSPLCFDGSVGLGQILRGVSGFAAVSYTHLDVYKRQVDNMVTGSSVIITPPFI